MNENVRLEMAMRTARYDYTNACNLAEGAKKEWIRMSSKADQRLTEATAAEVNFHRHVDSVKVETTKDQIILDLSEQVYLITESLNDIRKELNEIRTKVENK